MSMIRDVMTTISESLVEILTFVAEQLARIYDVLMDPLKSLKE